jgi:hypothetical protein
LPADIRSGGKGSSLLNLFVGDEEKSLMVWPPGCLLQIQDERVIGDLEVTLVSVKNDGLFLEGNTNIYFRERPKNYQLVTSSNRLQIKNATLN